MRVVMMWILGLVTSFMVLAGAKININEANVETLATLKGLGQKKAEAIVAYRDQHGPFKTVEELLNVNGIGKGILAKNEADLTVSAE